MHATPILIALLTASIAGPSLAQNAQYPPWPPPEGSSSYEQYPSQHGPPEPPPQSYSSPYDDQVQGAPNASQLGAPPPPQLVTPSQEGSKSLTTAAEAPLHEMNL